MEVTQKMDEGRIKAHFLLSTKGCCFLCFKPIGSDDDDGDVRRITRGRGGERGGPKRFKKSVETFSLQSLCHHLKLDVLKILSKKVSTSLSSISIAAEGVSLEKSDWRVMMCQTCGGMAARFSKLLQQLEILRMEVGNCLKMIQGCIEETNKDANVVDQFHKLMASDIQSLLYMGIVNELRKEVSRKCSVTAQPKVTLERLVEKKAGDKSTTNNTKVLTRSRSNAIKQNDLDKLLLLGTKKTPNDDKSATSLPSLIAEDSSSVTLSPSLQSEKRSSPSPSPTLAPGKESVPEADVRFRHRRKESQGKSTINTDQPERQLSCNLCQLNFNSVKEVNFHFSNVHLPSMQSGLTTHAESLVLSEQNKYISATQKKGKEASSVPSKPEPQPVKITNSFETSETVGPRDGDGPATAVPCKITEVFQIDSANKRVQSPVEGNEWSFIVSAPSVSSHLKSTSSPNDKKKPSISPDKRDHVCKYCGMNFTRGSNLRRHNNTVHKKLQNAGSMKPIKWPVGDTSRTKRASGIETRSQLTATSLSGNREQEQAINDDDAEIETACIETTTSTPDDDDDDSQYISTHWADPLSDVSISDMMHISNNSKRLGVAAPQMHDSTEPSTAYRSPVPSTLLQVHHPPGTSTLRMHNSSEPSAFEVYNLPGPSTLQMYSSSGPSDFQMCNSEGSSNLQMYNPAEPTTLQSYNTLGSSSTVQMYTQPVPATLQVHNQPELGMYASMSAPSSSTSSAQYYGLPPPVEASFSINSTTGVPECRLCGMQCVDLNEFQNHYNEDHLILPFACNYCDKRFADNMSLGAHCEKFHGLQQDAAVSATELLYPSTGYTQNPVTMNTSGPNSLIPITIILPNEMKQVQM